MDEATRHGSHEEAEYIIARYLANRNPWLGLLFYRVVVSVPAFGFVEYLQVELV
jgi:hypothetical protein